MNMGWSVGWAKARSANADHEGVLYMRAVPTRFW
jgi:hypothetical protein